MKIKMKIETVGDLVEMLSDYDTEDKFELEVRRRGMTLRYAPIVDVYWKTASDVHFGEGGAVVVVLVAE